MRTKDAISQVNIERDREVLKVFHKAQNIVGIPATVIRICEVAANLPASKFYISDHWAYRYVRDRLNGRQRIFKDRRKSTLYNALFVTYRRIAKSKEHQGKSLESLVNISLEQPAPFLGISPRTIQIIIWNKHHIYQYDIKKRHKIKPSHDVQ